MVVPVALLMFAFMTMAVLALVAVAYEVLAVKMAVPLYGVVLIAALAWDRPGTAWAWWLIGGLVASAVGDIFLSNLRIGGDRFFFIGTVFYVIAHVGYIATARLRGGFHLWTLATTIVVVGGVGLGVMIPRIESPVISGLIVVYSLISAVSLAAGIGIRGSFWSRISVSAALLCIIVSDIAIGFKLFLDDFTFDPIILPLYFAAHLLFTIDAVMRLCVDRSVVPDES